MTSAQPLRPYLIAAGAALGLYVLLNLAIYWLWVRPAPDAAPGVAPAAGAPAVAANTPAPAAPASAAAPAIQPAAFNVVPGAGDWVQENGAIVQRSTQLADLFAGSNLSGGQFTASVDLTWPAEGGDQLGGGFLFHMQSAGELAGAQMVRFHRSGQELLWGYFNEQGAFQGEGGAALALAAGRPHTLAVTVKETAFDVLVDGEVIASAIPLHRQSGLLGLIAYGGPLTFTNLQTDAGAVAPANP